jgi:hypothetical protein
MLADLLHQPTSTTAETKISLALSTFLLSILLLSSSSRAALAGRLATSKEWLTYQLLLLFPEGRPQPKAPQASKVRTDGTSQATRGAGERSTSANRMALAIMFLAMSSFPSLVFILFRLCLSLCILILHRIASPSRMTVYAPQKGHH